MKNLTKNLENLMTDKLSCLKLEKGKINIIGCSKSKTAYKNCFLIIE